MLNEIAIVTNDFIEQEIDWAKCEQVLARAEVHTSGTIEDSNADLHADFANRYPKRQTKTKEKQK